MHFSERIPIVKRCMTVQSTVLAHYSITGD